MPYADASSLIAVMILSAGPLTVFPAMIGLIATTGAFVFFISLRIAGIASIGAMLRMGLLGHIMSFCAFLIASSRLGAGLAFSAPSYCTSVTLMLVAFLTKYSWKSNVVLSVMILVLTRSLVIGISWGLTPKILQSSAVASESVLPSLSSTVLVI